MKAFVRVAIFILMFSAPTVVPAMPTVNAGESMLLAARGNQGGGRAESAPRIDSQQAAALVKRRYSDAKILSVVETEHRGSRGYRVKVLSADGVLKYVFVDGKSGNVSE